jgi:hypothetical protein
VDPRRRQTPPLVGQVADQLAGAQGRPGDRFSEHPLDLVGWVAVGIPGGRRSLGSSAASP